MFALGDKGYDGLDHDLVVTPFKGKGKPEWQKDYNRLHARLRRPGERMFAQLKKMRARLRSHATLVAAASAFASFP